MAFFFFQAEDGIRDIGVTGVQTCALPICDTAFLLMPAGRLGPSFLVSENFYVLKQYNESDLYALFIGHLADRLRGGSSFQAAWAPTDPMRRGDIWAMQERLQAQGHNVGKVDGLIGFATRTVIGQWQTIN